MKCHEPTDNYELMLTALLYYHDKQHKSLDWFVDMTDLRPQ